MLRLLNREQRGVSRDRRLLHLLPIYRERLSFQGRKVEMVVPGHDGFEQAEDLWCKGSPCLLDQSCLAQDRHPPVVFHLAELLVGGLPGQGFLRTSGLGFPETSSAPSPAWNARLRSSLSADGMARKGPAGPAAGPGELLVELLGRFVLLVKLLGGRRLRGGCGVLRHGVREVLLGRLLLLLLLLRGQRQAWKQLRRPPGLFCQHALFVGEPTCQACDMLLD